MFAGIMVVATVIFAVLAMRYKYVEDGEKDKREDETPKKPSIVSNLSSSLSSLDDKYSL